MDNGLDIDLRIDESGKMIFTVKKLSYDRTGVLENHIVSFVPEGGSSLYGSIPAHQYDGADNMLWHIDENMQIRNTDPIDHKHKDIILDIFAKALEIRAAYMNELIPNKDTFIQIYSKNRGDLGLMTVNRFGFDNKSHSMQSSKTKAGEIILDGIYPVGNVDIEDNIDINYEGKAMLKLAFEKLFKTSSSAYSVMCAETKTVNDLGEAVIEFPKTGRKYPATQIYQRGNALILKGDDFAMGAWFLSDDNSCFRSPYNHDEGLKPFLPLVKKLQRHIARPAVPVHKTETNTVSAQIS